MRKLFAFVILFSAAGLAGAAPPPDGPLPPVVAPAERPAPPAAPRAVLAFGGGFLGVGSTELNPELRAFFGAPKDRGVLIDLVEPGSAAQRAGVKVGDVLLTVDGEAIDSGFDLLRQVSRREPGETAELEIVRDRKPQRLTATIGEREGLWRRQEARAPRPFAVTPRADCPEECLVPLPALDAEWAERLAKEIERGFDRGELRDKLRVYERIQPEIEQKMKDLEKRLLEMEKRLKEQAAELDKR